VGAVGVETGALVGVLLGALVGILLGVLLGALVGGRIGGGTTGGGGGPSRLTYNADTNGSARLLGAALGCKSIVKDPSLTTAAAATITATLAKPPARKITSMSLTIVASS
jgi:hypothetical protein